MTLDEAIKHAEEVAAKCFVERSARNHSGRCGFEHLELAAWLRELKAYKEQEPCEDAISRKWTLDIVNNFVFDTETDRNRIIHIVRDTAPSVAPKQKWIPVSERLPELKQHVLLSCYGRVIYGRMISEDGNSGYPVFEICGSVGDKRPVTLETTVHSEYTTSRIKAWMPLPESYKGGKEE